MPAHVTEQEYQQYLAATQGRQKTVYTAQERTIPPQHGSKPEEKVGIPLQAHAAGTPGKAHKYHAVKVTIDGQVFASKWEGKVYTDFRWQFLAGLVTEPLLQVPFAIGVHYGRMRYYMADLVTIDLKTNCLLVVEAKGVLTVTYKQKKKVFEELYGITICERRR